MNGDVSWTMDNKYVTPSNTFPQNGSDVDVIWGVGFDGSFQQHKVPGLDTMQFTCIYGCGSDATSEPSESPTMTPSISPVNMSSPTMAPSVTIIPPTNNCIKLNTLMSIFIILCCLMFL